MGKEGEKHLHTKGRENLNNTSCLPGLMRGLHVHMSLERQRASAVAWGGSPSLSTVTSSSWTGARVSKCCSTVWGLMENIQVVQRLISVERWPQNDLKDSQDAKWVKNLVYYHLFMAVPTSSSLWNPPLRWRIQLLSVRSWVLFFISSKICCLSLSAFDMVNPLLFLGSPKPNILEVSPLQQKEKDGVGSTNLLIVCRVQIKPESTWTLPC